MTLPQLYQHVCLRAHAEIRYVDGRPTGYGSGSPFAMGLNTLVSRSFTDYVERFGVVGEWREHDVDDYKQGRVPDNSMLLQIALRATLDRMKHLQAFAYGYSHFYTYNPSHLYLYTTSRLYIYTTRPRRLLTLTLAAGNSTPSPSLPSTRASSTSPASPPSPCASRPAACPAPPQSSPRCPA